MKNCAICKRRVEEENAPILALGGFGNPRYLCEECSSDIELALYDKDIDTIESSMQRLSDKMAKELPDALTVETVKDLFTKAGERARKIQDGEYDFSEDESEEPEDIEDVPEELVESEEDKALDIRDAERAKKFDRVFNWITIGIIIAAAAFIIISHIK